MADGRWPARPRLGLGLGAAAAAAALVLVVVARMPVPARAPEPVTGTAAVAGLASVDPASTVTLEFSRPMNRPAVVRALRFKPATTVRTAWQGNRLLVRATHGFTPNSPYMLAIDRSAARTATGASLTADIKVFFGTAPAAGNGAPSAPPTVLPLTSLAPADEGSKAIMTGGGAVIATAGRERWGGQAFSGLIRFQGPYFERLAPATAAISLSRSGGFLAYLLGSGAGARIVMAAGDGATGREVSVPVDDGSPLGWIGDHEVLFVRGGHLQAVDRAGKLRSLAGETIDAAHDALVISPGGRYVFVRPAAAVGGPAPGQVRLLDLVRHSAHALTRIVGSPAFSADGATVAWIDGSRPIPRLDSAPSAGGVVLSVPLPLTAGDQVSDLAVAPDGGRVAYSVTPAGGSGGELRVADLSDGATLAVSSAGTGESPSWSPTGDRLAFVGHQVGQPEVQVATAAGGPAVEAVEGAITTFANAEVAGDVGALRFLSDPGVPVDGLPQPSRVVVVQVVATGVDAWRASLRLLVDPSPADPAVRSADETLRLRRDGASGRISVANVSAAALREVTSGPRVVRVSAGPQPETLTVTYDADMDASYVRGATMVRAGGRLLRVGTSYDASTRTVTVTLPRGVHASVQLLDTTGQRDIAGHHLSAPFQTSLTIDPSPALPL